MQTSYAKLNEYSWLIRRYSKPKLFIAEQGIIAPSSAVAFDSTFR